MEDHGLVSIVLPTYNRADLLGRAIDSVVAQTYAHWELIVWDDGSTDETRRVVDRYSDPRIQYLRGTNHGAAYARNRAIEASGGEYLAFLDSDDEWNADKLWLEAAALTSHPEIDVLFSDFLNVNRASTDGRRTFEEYGSALRLLDVDQLEGRLFVIRSGMPQAIAVENFIATDTVMVRRAAMEGAGCFDESLRNSMDFELWWRMSLAGARFAYLDRVCMTRRKLGDNLSGSSLASGAGRLKALDVCRRQTESAGRADLRAFLDRCYRNAWQNLITAYAQAGDWPGMLLAFRQSLSFGISLGSLRLLTQGFVRHAMAGPSSNDVEPGPS